MKLKLTRRQFGQVAAATTVAAAVGTLINRTVAQTPPVVILGVSDSVPSTDDSLTPEVDSTEDIDEIANITVTSILRPIVVQSLVLATGVKTTTLTTAPILEPGEQLSGFAALKDGTLVVSTNTFGKNAVQPTRLIILGASPRTVTVSEIKRQEALLSLLTRRDGSLGGIVGKKNGTPPLTIVTINLQNGEITEENKLPGNLRVTSAAECPDGNLYGIVTERRGETNLELIDKGKGQTTPLSFNSQPWNSGFSGLVCSSSNQLIALGARRYESPKYLHTIDKNSGVITRLTDFDVATIAIQI
ncbi:hypothetical protein [Iningainema tapete]|uniref:Uncharacterized protein n=1 Tax=Iningainema tapete BLCC-T55 TaxID=2748662 RepID=A0A8J7C967_9CYAN|nr:hypothetical protein [Iningainema tapete]MBD2775591.1 hypothetical protein [Iningainema tapete BLCC-T55]